VLTRTLQSIKEPRHVSRATTRAGVLLWFRIRLSTCRLQTGKQPTCNSTSITPRSMPKLLGLPRPTVIWAAPTPSIAKQIKATGRMRWHTPRSVPTSRLQSRKGHARSGLGSTWKKSRLSSAKPVTLLSATLTTHRSDSLAIRETNQTSF
jgi:hypothetical protein